MKDKKKKILIWFKIYDLMYMYANDEQKEKFNELINNAHLFYAADSDSYQSALERVYDDQVRMLPEGTDCTEDAIEYIVTDLNLESGLITASDCQIIGPEKLKELLLGENANKSPINYNQMNNEMKPMTEEDIEQMVHKLPGRVGEQLKGLMGAIDEVNETAGEIFARYAAQCDALGVDKEQAKAEAAQYMNGNMPAAEFIAPVGILDDLKKI
tara:strand:+ start:587 stop:1225 length:639 start_codon:yes stop_codon:yes gene_type:complete